jgi:hypothetical protein
MASGIDGDLVCVRCGNALQVPDTPPLDDDLPEHAFSMPESDDALGDVWLARGVPFDPFEFDARLGRARHILRLSNPAQPFELHTAHLEPLPASLRGAGTRPRESRTAGRIKRRSTIVSQVAWSAIVLGVAAFVCGAILVGWSLFGVRPELWDLGLPIVLGGQAALVVGLLLQLGRTDEDDDDPSRDEIDDLYNQLDAMQASQRLAGASSSSARSYYADLGSLTAPEANLADLKGQLDQLSVRLDEQRR